jgi:hypothetical protein
MTWMHLVKWVTRWIERTKMVDYVPDEKDTGTEAVERENVRYKWNPLRDITVYELALCLPYLMILPYGMAAHDIEQLPAQALRHFHKVLPGVSSY